MSQVVPVFRGRSRAVVLWLCSSLVPLPALTQSTPGVTLQPAAVPAAGRQVALLEVAEFGRYAIAVESARGTALQVVDRMTGAGDVAGEAGKQDGRVDLFLDRGAVRVVTSGDSLATGEATLAVTPFRERAADGAQPATAVQLVEGKPVDGELADFEQLSWWIEIRERRRVVFEAAGRNLADLRLWQSGSWLVDAAPVVSVIEPQSGRPLRLCQLAADLTPGLYRLSAYGGPEVAWSKGGVERPFHLRFGWPRDAQTVRARRTIGPFGFERVRMSGVADFFRLELPEALATDEAEVGLEVATLDEADPFALGGDSFPLTKENVPPVAEIRTASDPDRELRVTVSGVPGQAYVLQHFVRTRERELNARTVKSSYWISTVHAGPVGDAIDPTAILVRRTTGHDGAKRKSEVIASETVVLTGVAGWARRFNLLDTASLYVKVEQAGTYVLQSRGSAAQFRLEPLFLDAYPEGWQSPPMRAAPAEWQLDPGYYVLVLQPIEAGIAEIEIAAKGAPAVALAPPRPSVQLGVVPLSTKLAYRLYVSQQPGVESGMVVRELPLDLAAALPLALGPGEEVELAVRAAEPSAVRALTEEGGSLEISVDGAPWAGQAVGAPGSIIGKGEHRLRVRSTSDTTVLASIGLVSAAQLATTPLPELPAASLAALPAFPRLAASSSQALDLAAGEARTFIVAAEDSALYRLESTGLLATAGSLRTRTRANLLTQAENGIGRNFSLAAYLREGDYQLTVRPRGASAGHLGLELARAPIEEAGALAPGIPARATIDPRRALSYRFAVSEKARYTFSAWGLRNAFAVRLEDADGWPVAAPLVSGELAVELEPGAYRLIVLPQAVTARAVVQVSQASVPRELSGHGPHALTLDTEDSNLWLEPEAGAPRDPDRWRFTLPAATVVAITLSDEMMGELRPLTAGATVPDAGLVPPGRTFRGALAAGEYELAAVASRSNNRLRYRVAVRSDDLVDGGARLLRVPGEITLAVGTESQVELASFGRSDVRATLMTALGEPIAVADDRPGDWNFLLSERLASGKYRLRVDPVASASGTTTVAMRVLRERTADPIAAASSTVRTVRHRFEIGDEAVLVALARPAAAELIALGARSGESLGLTLEERQTAAPAAPAPPAPPSGAAADDVWRELASASGRAARLALPLAASTGDLRLRLWSLDRRPATVELTVYAGAVAHRSEAELARGFDLEVVPGIEPGLAAAIVDFEQPGCFRREGSDDTGRELLQALSAGSIFERAAPTLAPVGFALPLAAASEGTKGLRVQARRAFVGEGDPLLLGLPPGTAITCDVADGGPAVVELEATAGEPVVAFLDGRGTFGPATAWGPASGGRVLSAKGAGKGRAVELWNAGAGTVEARLSGWIATSAPADRQGWGSSRTVVDAHGVRLLELPAGEKDLRLTLAPGTAVLALAPPNTVAADAAEADADAEALLWAPVDATTESLRTGASRLLIFGGAGRPGEASLELLPRSATAGSSATAARPLSDQQRFELRFSSTGAFRVPVAEVAEVAAYAAGGARRLHLRGTGAALFVGGDGRLQRGSDFDLTAAGGSLRFEHPPGLVSAWIDAADAADAADAVDLASSAGVELGETARSLALPATVELAGAKESFAVEVAAPSLLKLRGTGAVAVAVGVPATRSEVYPQGAHFDAVLPAGKSVIAIRGLAGENLTGTLTMVAEALRPLGEGLGDESLLAPGDSRGYSFKVSRPGPVGVGVRADQGDVETRLYDGAGRFLGKGVVQWLTFEAGDYVLVVAAPAAGRPARVRPALVGASPPGSGPPPEEARRFLALAAGEIPPVAGIAGTEDLSVDWLGVRAREEDGSDESDESERSEEGYDSGYDDASDEMPDEGEASEESEWSDENGEGE